MANTKIPSELVAINAISGTLIADNAITSVHIAENNITAVQIAINAVTALQMADGTITSAKIADGTIVTADIADGQITTGKLADSSVTTGKIAAGTIASADIANNAILTQHIDDNQITADQIADNAVGVDQLAGITRGSVLTGNAAGNPSLLALGAANTLLQSDGTDLVFAPLQSGIDDNSNAVAITIDSSENTTFAGNMTLAFDSNNSGNRLRIADTEGASAAVRTYSTSDGTGLILNHYYAASGSPYMRYSDFVSSMGDGAATTMRFLTKPHNGNPTVALTIDNSQNVMIGKTSTSFTTAGIELATGGVAGKVQIQRASSPLTLVNLADDGGILNFYKGTTNIGSIGTVASALSIGSGDTGLFFQPAYDRILPFTVTGNTGRDAAIDLGVSTTRFKDLHLSGNIAVGGTVDGVDIQTLNTTAGAALPKAGGTLTGTLNAVAANFSSDVRISGWLTGASDTNTLYSGNSTGTIIQTPSNTNNAAGSFYIRDSLGSVHFTLNTNTNAVDIVGTITSSGAVTTPSTDVQQFRILQGTATAGGIFKERTITGAGVSNDVSIFAESITDGGEIHFMTGGSAAKKMTITNNGRINVTQDDHNSITEVDRVLNWYGGGGTELNNSRHFLTAVNNRSETTQPMDVGLALTNKNTTNSNWSPAITFGGMSKNNGYMNGGAAIASQNTQNSGDANFITSDLHFFTKNQDNSKSLGSKMTILGGGNVGIGTSTPGAKLEISGKDDAGASDLLRLQFDNSPGDTGITFTDINSTVKNRITMDSTNTADLRISSGTKIHLYGGTTNGTSSPHLTVSNDGNVTTPSQTYFSVKASSDQSISVTTWTDIAWGTETTDTGGNFASNTFTAPVAGVYLFTGVIGLNTIAATNYLLVRIVCSSAGDLYTTHEQKRSGGGDYGYDHAISLMITLAASETVKMQVFAGSGGTHQVGSRSLWQGRLLG